MCFAGLLFSTTFGRVAPDVPFTVNEHGYPWGYYLCDGIYPDFSTFVKAFKHPPDLRRDVFRIKQESARKDIERAFGVLKAK